MFFRSQCGQAEGQSEDTLKAVMIGVSSIEGPLYQKHDEGCCVGEGCQLATWEVGDWKDLDALIN